MVPIFDVGRRGGWALGQFWMDLEDLTFTGVQTATIQPAVSHYTDCAVQVTIMMY